MNDQRSDIVEELRIGQFGDLPYGLNERAANEIEFLREQVAILERLGNTLVERLSREDCVHCGAELFRARGTYNAIKKWRRVTRD